MVHAGRIRFLWWAPPCTTFSLARCPELRSLLEPWGFSLLKLAVVRGNLHAAMSMVLAFIQVAVGNFMGGEQPAFGFMRAIHGWKALVSLPGVLEVLFDWCRFCKPHRKTTRLVTNFEWLKSLGKRCNHKFRHEKLEGSRTTMASEYSKAFCGKVADLWLAYRETLE